jgi:DNA-binding transcriptional ArsR family regulator
MKTLNAGISPFEHMARTLAPPTRTGARRPGGHVGQPGSRVAALRRALENGPLPVAELAAASGVPAMRIRGLLKADIDRGRVRIRLDGRGYGIYELAEDYDGELQEALAAATRLLTKHGRIVTMRRESAGG